MDFKDKIQTLPHSPGVYLMKDAKGNILYVGKSKNLKNRVQSYFYQSKNHSPKVKRLVKHIADFEHILTDTEFEAFMLECHLIKKLQPPYNRQMKNTRTYCYVVIREKNGIRYIDIVDTLAETDDVFFGPFHSRKRVEEAVFVLKEFYKIACLDPFNNEKRPCLNYSIGTCIGICCNGGETLFHYDHVIGEIISFLKGENRYIIDKLKAKMVEASHRFAFEEAGEIHNKLKTIKFLQRNEQVVDFTKENHNIVVLEELEDDAIKLFLIKGNKLLFKEKYAKQTLENELKNIVSMIQKEFNVEKNTLLTSLKKDEIDEAQIIYRYLKSSQCEYFIVPDEWIKSGLDDRLIHSLKQQLLNFY